MARAYSRDKSIFAEQWYSLGTVIIHRGQSELKGVS